MRLPQRMLFLPILLLPLACGRGAEAGASPQAAPSSAENASGSATVLGAGLSLDHPLPLGILLASPAEYEGKKVQIQGTVVGVCEMRGCWLELAGDRPGQSIRVKVKDGEIVFPLTAKGHRATVEGTVERIETTGEDGPKTVWRLHGLGARIEG